MSAERDNTEGGSQDSYYSVFNARTYVVEPEIQRRFLALFVQDPTFLHKYRRFCKAIYFSQESLYVVADQILKHFDKNVAPPDQALLLQRLKILEKRGKRKVNLKEAVEAVDAIFQEEIGSSKATLREWVLEFGKIEHTKLALKREVELLKDGKYDDIQEVMRQRLDFYRVAEFEDADGAFVDESLEKDLVERRERIRQRIPTGIPAIDRYLGGGLGLGQLYTIAAGTGIGKTTAVTVFCRGAVHANYPTLLVSTELTRARIVDKVHAAMCGVPTGQAMLDAEDWIREKIETYYEKRKNLFHIVWFEPYSATMDDVKEYIRFLGDRYNFFPKLIAFDSPDLLKPRGRYQKPHEGLGEIYTSIFAMTNRDHVATLVTTDVKHASRDKLLVGVTDIGGAYEKGKKSDGLFGIGRGRSQVNPETGAYSVWFHIDKLRTDGSSGMVLEIEVAANMARWTGIRTLTSDEIDEGLYGSIPDQEEGGEGEGQPRRRKGRKPPSGGRGQRLPNEHR